MIKHAVMPLAVVLSMYIYYFCLLGYLERSHAKNTLDQRDV